MSTRDFVLGVIVAFAFVTEAAVGFGATIVTVALGALLLPIETILPAFVPVNVVLSTFIVTRNLAHVDRRLLFLRVLPAMAAGFPIGFFAASRLPTAVTQLAFAAFVLVLSAIELARLARSSDAAPKPVSTAAAVALLFLGGAVHGAFATGGPPAVYVCGRTLSDKRAFRATLSTLWLLLNGALVAAFVAQHRIDTESARRSLVLLPGLVIGGLLGDRLHHRIPERTFRIALFALLVLVALVLAARAVT